MVTTVSPFPLPWRVLSSVAVVMMTLSILTGCTPRLDSPIPVAEQFFSHLRVGDIAAAATFSDNPQATRLAFDTAWAGLHTIQLDPHIRGSHYSADTGTVYYRYTWTLANNRIWSYDGELPMVRNDGQWQIRWTPTILHPKLGEHQNLLLQTDPAPRATVKDMTGIEVLKPGYTYSYALSAKRAGRRLITTAHTIADTLASFDPSLGDAQQIAEQASSTFQPLDLIVLNKNDHDHLAATLDHLPGMIVTAHEDLFAVDENFAPAVIQGIKKDVATQLDGTAGWRIIRVNQNGSLVSFLHEVPPAPAASLTISIDRNVQRAAQLAVDTHRAQAVIVVLKASTGDILAIAQNDAADEQGLIATTGLFPPGSTFKMITAGAAIDQNMAQPDSMVACPGIIDIGSRRIPNYGGFDLGVVPMSRAFANSCNTTFAALASKMHPRDLTQTAARYGIGRDYQIHGLDTITGVVPPTVDLTERTEDGFGQGKVLVSPFGVALSAATIAAGKTPVPWLIAGHPTTTDTAVDPLSPAMLEGLRQMMRLVVTDGTARDIAGCGPVYGKTGEAEFSGGSHSWFAGYRGDLAFASLIVGGGSSEAAVRMTKMMFTLLPDHFMISPD